MHIQATELNNVHRIIENNKCTGCMACFESCAIGAISSFVAEDTFRYPFIDEKKCIQCGNCLKHCSGIYDEGLLDNTICYAVQAETEVRLKSSSGGVFSVICKSFIENGGAVCGAAFVNGKVKHIMVDSVLKLDLIRRSKYIQSDCSACYYEIKQAINSGKRVLFAGTPCQCSAVRKMFPEEVLLYVIDILCMGVPSQEIFDRYLDEEKYDKDLTTINFRNKTKYGWDQNLVLEIEKEGQTCFVDSNNSSYYGAFLDGYSIRNSCSECEYAGKKRVGDITLGDFWGIEFTDGDFADRMGTSLVLVNSEKGKFLFHTIQQELINKKEFNIDVAIQSNPILKYPTLVSSKQREFLANISSKSLRENYNDLKSNKADCGIINYWWCNDNGAILTAFALQKLLEKNGYTSRLINICEGSQLEVRSGGISSKFERRYLYTTEQITSEKQFVNLNNSFDHFIVGSDQVFRAEWVSNRYFLDFVDLDKDKIAMSASFGVAQLGVPYTREKEIEYLLHRFNNISIRELSGVSLCNNYGIKAEYVIDPVFLVDKKIYVDLLENEIEEDDNDPYALVYYRDLSESKYTAALKAAEKYSLRVSFVDDETSVETFLKMFWNAKFVITDSYHGLCFALIFNKNFVCFKNALRGNERFDTLAAVLKIPKYKFVDERTEDLIENLNASLDWEILNREIDVQRKNGEEWLVNALKTPSKINVFKVWRAWLLVCFMRKVQCLRTKIIYNRFICKLFHHFEEKIKGTT